MNKQEILAKIEEKLNDFTDEEIQTIDDFSLGNIIESLEDAALPFETEIRELSYPVTSYVLNLYNNYLGLDLTFDDFVEPSLDFWRSIVEKCQEKGCGGYDTLEAELEKLKYGPRFEDEHVERIPF